MSTSGSTDWTLTRNGIIQQSFEDIGVIGENETPTPEKIFTASRRLNGIIKTLQQDHIGLWLLDDVQQTITASSGVTNGGSTYRCILSHTSSATDEPGVGANWSTYWILDDSVTSPSTWVVTTAYTSAGDFTVASDTIGINYAFIRENGSDYPVEIITREDYANILTKSDQGKPYKIVFDRQLSPRVYFYYQPDSTDYVLHYTRVRRIEDFDDASDNFDGDVSWLRLLIKMLARDMCGLYRIPQTDRDDLDREIARLRKLARQFDKETTDGEFLEGTHANRREGWRNHRRGS